MAIEFPGETENQWIASLRRYFEEEMELEIGDLKAMLLLKFFSEEMAPTVYNGAIRDAQAYFRDKTVDLEGSCFQEECAYWR